MEDSDSEDGAIPGSYLTHHRTDHDRNRLAAAARWPPPGAQQNGVSAVDTQLWQNGVQRMLTADAQPRHATHRDSGRHRHATAAAQPTAKAVYQSPALDSPVGHDRRGMEDDAGPSNHANGAVHAGFKHSGNLTGDLTGLNAQSDDRGSIGAGPHASGPMDETGPAVGKIKLKIRRPVSAASETYDQSWFAEHLVRQPQLQAPIQDLTEVTDSTQ